MRFDIMTLFPDLVEHVLGESIIGRAQDAGFTVVKAHNIRDYSEDKHRRVDDTPYGGGKGMLMAAPPIYNCYRGVLADQLKDGFDGRVIYLSPGGRVLTQQIAEELAQSYDNLILLCGHYEGVDRRIVEEIVDEEISIGNYVLTGGELAACIIADSIVRLIPGAIGDEASALSDSFQDNLLAPPVYTRPAEFRGWRVPDVLLSGNFAEIEKWQENQAYERTKLLRPDLLEE